MFTIPRPKTVWLQMKLLLQPSLTRHVRVAEKPLPHVPLVTELMITMLTFVPLAMSTAMGKSKVHGCKQLMFLFVAQETLGGVVSRTVTVCEQLTLLLHASESSQVRVALKVGAQKPVVLVVVLTTRTVRLLPPPTSVPVGKSKSQTMPYSTVLPGAQVGVGGVVSITETVWLQ
jgi:hypothetical protein